MQNQTDFKPHIIKINKFFHDQQFTSNIKNSIVPTFAQPRYPFEVLFAIGGWCESITAVIEMYDLKSDSWVQVFEEDPYGPRAYHGCVVRDNCIYTIGGFDGFNYLNSCTKFNAITKSWEEISPMNCIRYTTGLKDLMLSYIHNTRLKLLFCN